MTDQDESVFQGIRFAVSRMGFQFSAEQEDRYAEKLFVEYKRVEDRKRMRDSMVG